MRPQGMSGHCAMLWRRARTADRFPVAWYGSIRPAAARDRLHGPANSDCPGLITTPGRRCVVWRANALAEQKPEKALEVLLERIVLKALAKEVEDRYQSAIDLHDDLQAYLYSTGEFYSRKDLASWMKRLFGAELEEENAKNAEWEQLEQPTPGPMLTSESHHRSSSGSGRQSAREWDEEELETVGGVPVPVNVSLIVWSETGTPWPEGSGWTIVDFESVWVMSRVALAWTTTLPCPTMGVKSATICESSWF